ncbi:HAD family hydrolase [Proteiniborus sp. MB09-C3]|uniref:HAD family hydrolase n=1 Tax=Proteiniborus sp. MB09-C3 TaxID=3050072 RepID=UPI0025549AED|nr:HAD family hydrolase [Proteiniborus sp. MB09-C3]WIV11053.1 HAD family hydrolase [Proteiniborus sp. MB09-C3]
MKYKAIFFDRDGTLTYGNKEKLRWYNQIVEEWSRKEFKLDYDRMMQLFDLARYPKSGLKSLDEEKKFWKRYYEELLKAEGVSDLVEERAELLFSELWCNNDKNLFDEVIEVMEYFKDKGYKIGIISDTSPSLQLSLENLGLGKYIDSYTCSDLVGVGKPEPLIYNSALKSLNVEAIESIYVDDYDIEADGARKLGFTSFHLDRSGHKKNNWTIQSLKEIIDYVELMNG